MGAHFCTEFLGRKVKIFPTLSKAYITYVHKHYPFATVVFDGYPVRPTVKDTAHIGRTHGINPLKVDFSEEMPCKMKKRLFPCQHN